MINILIVDDSATEAQLLKHLFEAEKDLHVIGWAKNGTEAAELTAKLKPDIITMDILMPMKNGFEATHHIMTKTPTPIVVISSAANDKTLNTTFLALEAGALSVLEKPDAPSSVNYEQKRKKIIDTVRSMSQIKVIKRRFYKPASKPNLLKNKKIKAGKFEIIAIGVSVGGPQALKTIFSKLPSDFPIPIVVVQHMTTGFLFGFANWLNQHCSIRIKIAENNEELMGGTIYFAPDSTHLKINRAQNKLFVNLVKSPPVSGFCPSATVLLQSVAKVSAEQAVGILLTGMGNDGAQGLLELKNAKGHTLIQDQESAVVFGMAGVAQSLNAVDEVVQLDKFADYLISLSRSR
jgi:two-component system chemotaxis response regulator CheB